MSNQIGVSQEILDAIELRLIGVDHRPWILRPELCDEYGKPYICKGSRKALVKATEASRTWTPNANEKERKDHDPRIRPTEMEPDAINMRQLVSGLALFRLCDQANNDMGQFVAHAPEDIEVLLNEVKSSRARLRRIEDEREEFRKELLSLRVEKASLQEKLTAMRRTVRDFSLLMKEVT